MWPLKNFIHRPNDPLDKRVVEEARKVIEESMRVLRAHPPPDTFLGRKKPVQCLSRRERLAQQEAALCS
jgi:hypothetical protein